MQGIYQSFVTRSCFDSLQDPPRISKICPRFEIVSRVDCYWTAWHWPYRLHSEVQAVHDRCGRGLHRLHMLSHYLKVMVWRVQRLFGWQHRQRDLHWNVHTLSTLCKLQAPGTLSCGNWAWPRVAAENGHILRSALQAWFHYKRARLVMMGKSLNLLGGAAANIAYWRHFEQRCWVVVDTLRSSGKETDQKQTLEVESGPCHDNSQSTRDRSKSQL